MNKPALRPFSPSIRLSLSTLPAISPAGPGEQLILTATDQSGIKTRTEFVPKKRPPRRRPKKR